MNGRDTTCGNFLVRLWQRRARLLGAGGRSRWRSPDRGEPTPEPEEGPPAAEAAAGCERNNEPASTPSDTTATPRMEGLEYRPRLSLITIVHEALDAWLRGMVASVRAQTYPRWELCIVDQSTSPRTRGLVERLASADRRVRVQRGRHGTPSADAPTRALRAAKGEFVAILDPRDELAPDALLAVVTRLNEEPDLDLIYTDEDCIERDGRHVEPFHKPDWSPDLLLSMNYISGLAVLRRRLVEDAGGFRGGFDGSEDFDLFLRVTERSRRITRIPSVLYHRRKAPASAGPLPDESARRALEDALRRRGCEGRVEQTGPGRYAVRYGLRGRPKVSIIIPTRDHADLLRACVESVETMTDYAPYEIIVLDNDSVEAATAEYLCAIEGRWRVIRCPGPFNFARINNAAVDGATGDHLLFLNNDTRVRRREWLTAMVEQAQRPEVGAVGARLLYPDARIQHAGVVLGVLGVAGHAFRYCPSQAPTYFDFGAVVRNVSAVTGACMLVPRRVFEEVGRFDERFAIAFNDVDLCCRIRQRGYLIVYTPLAELEHLESASRHYLHPSADDALMWQLWGDLIKTGDPYYNPNLTRIREDWGLLEEAGPAGTGVPSTPSPAGSPSMAAGGLPARQS